MSRWPRRQGGLIAVASRTFFNFVGMYGASLILYSVVSSTLHEPWPLVERCAGQLSSIVTLVSTVLTASSVYFYGLGSRPSGYSRTISAPIVILGAIIALGILFIKGTIPVHVINGFGMMALAGAWFRLQPRP